MSCCPKFVSPRVCPRRENMLFVVSCCGCCAFGVSLCHGVVPDVNFTPFCMCGIRCGTSWPTSPLIDPAATKSTSPHTILRPPVQNEKNAMLMCRLVLPHANRIMDADASSSCILFLVLKRRSADRSISTETLASATAVKSKCWQQPSRSMQSSHPHHKTHLSAESKARPSSKLG